MARVFVPTELTKYSKCPKCGADLRDLLVGGTGVWQNSILCRVCTHLQRGVSYNHVIIPLVALQYKTDPQKIREADQTSQAEYEAIALGDPPYPDLPAVTTTARFILRRRLAAGQEV